MVLLLISMTVAAGGDLLASWPRSEDIKNYDSNLTYRLNLDLAILERHKIGVSYHPVEFLENIRTGEVYDFKGSAIDFYYGFDLTTIFLNIPPKLFMILGGSYHPWHLEDIDGKIVELQTGKADFKDWGYLGGLELDYAPVDFVNLRLGGYYYFLTSGHMDILGFQDHDERYIAGFIGLRFQI